MRGLPDGSAGLPRRGFAPSRNDNGGDGNGRGGRVSAFGRVSLRCHCEPVRAWQSSLRRNAGTALALLDQILQNLLGQALVDFAMPWNGLGKAGLWVMIDIMLRTALLQNRCKIIEIHARLPQDAPKRTAIQFTVHRYHTSHRTRIRFLSQNDVRTTLTRKTKPQSLQSLPGLLARDDRQFRHEPGLPRNSPRSYQCPF